MLRSFPLDTPISQNHTAKVDWPIFKWSFDGKYLAKVTTGKNGALSVYEAPNMGLIDKKSFKVENIQEFYWSPSENTISFWTPEEGNIPARVTLIKVPSREILRTKNLFNVTQVNFFIKKLVQIVLASTR